jgi:hypothetical protein
MRTMARSPGRRMMVRTAAPPPVSMMAQRPLPAPQPQQQRGLGALQVAPITMRAAQDLDTWYKANGCAGCDDMGSDLRMRTLTFKAAALLDPATMNQVSLNVSTPLAQSGFGPGTDAALTLVLGATRQSTGHCTDDNGFCTAVGQQTPPLPPELAALQDGLNKLVNGVIGSGQQVPQTDATITMLVQQIVAGFKQFADQLKQFLGAHEQPHPPPIPPLPPVVGVTPAVPPPPMPQAKSEAAMALGVVGIALVALGTGAVIMTYSHRKARR